MTGRHRGASCRAISFPRHRAHARWAWPHVHQKVRWPVMRLRSETEPTGSGQVAPVVTPPRRSHVGRVVAGSLAAGFAAAVILPFLPVGKVDVDFATAMVLFGFALGWALIAVLSARFTDQPQRWAVVPAIFMALSGALVLLAPDAVVDALGW